jgi:hypothetical protein
MQVNLSERLAKAAMERLQPKASAPQGHVAATESQSTSAHLPDRTPDPVDSGRVTAMKMRLPEPTSPETTTESSGLPLWQRPFVDVMRDAGLATVTSLPIRPRENEAIDEDLDHIELAQTIPMPGVWTQDADVDDLHVPPLASAESLGLADGSLSSDHVSHPIDDDHNYLSDRMAMIDLDDVTVGPIDLRDETPLPRVEDEHNCPQCGAKANVDIHDPMRGRIHLSCDSCFKMWQVRVEPTVQSDQPFMRD